MFRFGIEFSTKRTIKGLYDTRSGRDGRGERLQNFVPDMVNKLRVGGGKEEIRKEKVRHKTERLSGYRRTVDPSMV